MTKNLCGASLRVLKPAVKQSETVLSEWLYSRKEQGANQGNTIFNNSYTSDHSVLLLKHVYGTSESATSLELPSDDGYSDDDCTILEAESDEEQGKDAMIVARTVAASTCSVMQSAAG